MRSRIMQIAESLRLLGIGGTAEGQRQSTEGKGASYEGSRLTPVIASLPLLTDDVLANIHRMLSIFPEERPLAALLSAYPLPFLVRKGDESTARAIHHCLSTSELLDRDALNRSVYSVTSVKLLENEGKSSATRDPIAEIVFATESSSAGERSPAKHIVRAPCGSLPPTEPRALGFVSSAQHEAVITQMMQVRYQTSCLSFPCYRRVVKFLLILPQDHVAGRDICLIGEKVFSFVAVNTFTCSCHCSPSALFSS